MNIIKKYWNDVYRYILLLIPGTCICAGITYTFGKFAGWFPDAPWLFVLLFAFSQLIYLGISFCFTSCNIPAPDGWPRHCRSFPAPPAPARFSTASAFPPERLRVPPAP